MGKYLSSVKEVPYDKTMLVQMKKIRIKELTESTQYMVDIYPGEQRLTFEMFDDVFSANMSDTESLFMALQTEKNMDKEIDVYEAMAAFCVFSGDNFERKLEFIFELFDFDQSKKLELVELVMTVQAVLRSMCKLTNLPVPSLTTCESFASEVFLKIDKDSSGTIELGEFAEYVKSNAILQDFFLKYTGTQTIQNAERRMKVVVNEANDLFNKYKEVIEETNTVFVDPDAISTDLAKTFSMKPGEVDEVIKTLINSSQDAIPDLEGKIEEGVWSNVVNALAAYRSVDINQDNSCNVAELHQLIWLYEGEEPNEFRLRQTLAEIDTDGNGEISIVEWMAYLCSGDVKKGKKQVFRGQLKALFRKYDKDGSDSLSKEEIRLLIKETLKEYFLKAASNKDKLHQLEEITHGTTEKIIERLDLDGSQAIQWKEFRRFMDEAMATVEELKEFLDKAL